MMKPGYKFLFILVSLFIILEVTNCTDEEVKEEVAKGALPVPKNRYIVEKTQNVTEKREAVPKSVDDGFQESFRKVRKVHRKLVNKKLRQYDETEDLERKRIKDSVDAPKKNIAEVQHVIQKMKIVENPSYPADRQNIGEPKEVTAHTSEQKQKTADDSETQEKVTRSETITQDESKPEEHKETVLPSTETKTVDSEIEVQEEGDKADSLNTSQQKRIITSPERKGKKVIRTIYVTEGKNTHAEEDQDNLESEYSKLKESANEVTSHEKDAGGTDTEKRVNITETEEKIGENRESLPKQKKFIEVEDEKNTEADEARPYLYSRPRIRTRRIIIRRPVKIIRKNISRSAKEEEQKENRREEETFVDSEVRTVPIRRKKKIITSSETEKDQSKNVVEGTEDSETVIEKPEGQESVKHITIKRTRSGKDTKRSDKTNTEDVEIITDSDEPLFESKTGTISKPRRISRRIITETTENEADSENDPQKNRKKITNVIENTDLDADKNTLKSNVNEKEPVDVSVDAEKETSTVDTHAQGEETVEVHTERTIHTTISLKREPTSILETEIVDKSVPSERKTTKVSRTITEGVTDDKAPVKPRTVRTTKKQTKDKHGAATKSKAIADIEEEIRLMLLEQSQTKKPKGSKKPKSPKGTKKTVIVTNRLESESETPESHLKPMNVIESTDKLRSVLGHKNKIITTQKDYAKAPKTVTRTKKLKNMEITTTMPRLIIKDKVLTEVKIQEDTNYLKTNLPKRKSVDSMEPETETGDINESQNSVVKKIVKPATSKDVIKITETKDKIPKLKAKNLTKFDIQKGGVQVTETGTDKKTTVVQDIVEPYFTTVKKSSLREPETEKKETEIESEVKKQVVETDETNVIKTPSKVVKKVTIRTEVMKDGDMPETEPKIRPSDETEMPTSVIVKKTTTGSDAQKDDHQVSAVEDVTKKQPGEAEVIDKTEKLPGSRPKVIKKIITTTTLSETEEDHEGSKPKSQDEKVKESGRTSGPSTITVKKISKAGPETHKEDTAVPEIDTETDKLEPVKETGKVPDSNTVVVQKVRKPDSEPVKEDAVADTKTEEIKVIKEIEKSPDSSTVVLERVKKIDSETQKEDTEVGTENTEDKHIKDTEKSPEAGTVTVKRFKKIDSETEQRGTKVDTKPHPARITKEFEKTPEPSTEIVREVKKVDSQTQKEDTEIDSKANEPVISPESRKITVKTVKNIDSETEKDDAEVDTKTNEAIPTKKTRKTPYSSTLIVRKVKKIDSETQKDDSEDDTKTHEVKTTKEAIKYPETRTVVVRKVKKIDSEIQKDDSEDDTISREVKTTRGTDKTPESSTAVVKKVKVIDSETQKDVSEDDTKPHELKTTVQTGKSPSFRTVIVRKEVKSDSKTQKDESEDDNKTHEVKTAEETGEAPESSIVVVKKAKKIDSETQADDSEDDTKTHVVKTTKKTRKPPESSTVVVKKVKKIDSESQTEVAEDDTKAHEVKTTKETGKTPESSIVVVKKTEKIDSETLSDVSEDDTKIPEVKTTKKTGKPPESITVIVKKVNKIDSETKEDVSEDDTKTPEAKTTKETREVPESKAVIVRKEKKIDSETQMDDNKTHEIKTSKETGSSPESNTVLIVKTIRKIDSEREKDASDVTEVDSKGKVPSSEAKFSKDIEKAPETSTVITKQVRRIDRETEKDDTNVDTKTDVVKPTKESGKTPEFGAVVVKKMTDSEIQKEAVDVPDVDTGAKVQSGEVRPSKDIDNAPKIRTIIVKAVRKADSEAENEGADVSEVNTTIKKHKTDVKLNDKLEKLPESRTVTTNRIIVEPETATEDTEVSDHVDKVKKQPGHIEIVETSKVIQPDMYKDHMKNSQVDNVKETLHIISDQANKVRNLPAEAKTTQETVVTNKIVDSGIEKDNEKKTEDIELTNQPKGDMALTTSHTITSSQIEDEKDVRKDKRYGNVVSRITETIASESEKDGVKPEKKQLVASGDKVKKDKTVIIKSKTISAPEKISVTSEQLKAKTKTQEDLEELVEKDEIITDAQVIEEEVDDESAASQNVKAAYKQGSKSISKVAKTGKQKFEHQTGISQDRVLSKDSAVQHVTTGTVGKVTAGGKPIIIPKHPRRTMRGSLPKGREAAEFLFLLENDAEPTGLKDPSVAAELMSKLRVSKTRNYTTYHVNRGKGWSNNVDVSALLLRLQVSAAKIRNTREVSVPYLETIQELQKRSTKYIQDGYQASHGTQVKLKIKQFEKIQNAYFVVETSLQNEVNVLTEVAVKAICEIRSGMFKMECFKEKYPIFEKFLNPAEPEKKGCYGNVRKLSEWTKAVPELWKNKERRLNKLQASLDNLKKSKEECKPGQNIKKSIAGLLCDIFNYMDVQARFLNFSVKLESIAKLARREINICNKKEPIDPTLDNNLILAY